MNFIVDIGNKKIQIQVIERTLDTVHFFMEGKEYHFSKKSLVSQKRENVIVLEDTNAFSSQIKIVKNRNHSFWCGLNKLVLEMNLNKLADVGDGHDTTHPAEFDVNELSPLLLAPMPGKIVKLLTQEGQFIQKGHPVMIMEAMKMEHTIYAPCSGHVEIFCFKENDIVEYGAELARITDNTDGDSTVCLR